MDVAPLLTLLVEISIQQLKKREKDRRAVKESHAKAVKANFDS